MQPTDRAAGPLRVALTGGATELGLVVTEKLARAGIEVSAIVRHGWHLNRVKRAGGRPVEADTTRAGALAAAFRGAAVVLHLSPQVTNTLLHDGRAWRGWRRRLPLEASAVVDAARAAGVPYLVVGSYAALYGEARDATEETPIAPPDDPVFAAAAEAERIVQAGGVPSCLVRLGFLYGPQSKDLSRYVTSFQLFRPYYAGPEDTLGNWVHFEDAADALLRIVERRPAAPILNVVDGHPVNFGTVIDRFAALMGFRRPGHLPLALRRVYQFFIWRPQQVLLDTTTTVRNDLARALLGWAPRFPSYEDGLQQTVAVWRERGRP
ncbi:MAG: NAD(P)-dependent oxidoreductase [Chloroflexota bacterium]|nr:NAD(P)-dependent oxidoreductase [Dehalococcoidia bacterium]MDW8255297.1 NAD(P)-dependent oxidoreductase [Chloroflexota bacterium]